MNTFDQLKTELIQKHGHVTDLPLWARVLVWFQSDSSEVGLLEENEMGTFHQWAVLVRFRDREYIRRFGKVNFRDVKVNGASA